MSDDDNKKVNNSPDGVPDTDGDDIFNGLFDFDKLTEEFEREAGRILGASPAEEGPQEELPAEIIPEDITSDEPPQEERTSTGRRFELDMNAEPVQQPKKVQKKKTAPSKAAKKKPAKAPKGLYTGRPAYDIIYNLGNDVINCVRALVLLIFNLFATPIKIFVKALNSGKEKDKSNSFKIRLARRLKEIINFRDDIKDAKDTFKKVYRDPARMRKAFSGFFASTSHRHSRLLRSIFNTLVPAAAVIVLVFTTNYWKDVTFALEVTYNNESLGYIEDESVYIEAQDLIKKKLDTGAYTVDGETVNPTTSLNAEYKLKLVSIEDLNDANTICDRVIENSVDDLTNACGIYIDGDFIAAVKNEADAKTIFYNILEPYEADADAGGYTIGFAEHIDYVQGLFPENNGSIIDAAALARKLDEKKLTPGTHTVRSGDSMLSIAEDCDMTLERLRELNPGYDWDNMYEGDTVNVETGSKFVRIQKTVTTSKLKSVEFDTITTFDSSKYQGYQRITREGVPGMSRVTTTKTYIDGEPQAVTEDVVTLTEPITQLMVVGSMGYSGGGYVGSASSRGFLWPAPSCHRVSSPYGYRSMGFHNGIDLVAYGGGALGTAVIASRAGTVEIAGYSNNGYGYTVLINHGDGYKTRYGHMLQGSLCVNVGDYVYAGQQIGRVGSTGNSTGPHLHFEVIYYGEKQNPYNYLYS